MSNQSETKTGVKREPSPGKMGHVERRGAAMETTTHNVLVKGHLVLDKPRSGIAPKNTHPSHHQGKSEREDVVMDVANKIVNRRGNH